jgi:hypothetical protein
MYKPIHHLCSTFPFALACSWLLRWTAGRYSCPPFVFSDCRFSLSIGRVTWDCRDEFELIKFYQPPWLKHSLHDVMRYWFSCVILGWRALRETTCRIAKDWNEISIRCGAYRYSFTDCYQMSYKVYWALFPFSAICRYWRKEKDNIKIYVEDIKCGVRIEYVWLVIQSSGGFVRVG